MENVPGTSHMCLKCAEWKHVLSLSVYASWASCGLFSLFLLLPSPFAHWVLPESMWSPFVVSAQHLYKYLAVMIFTVVPLFLL